MSDMADIELRKSEAAARAARSERTIERWIASGDLPVVRDGVSVRIDAAELDRFLAERAAA